MSALKRLLKGLPIIKLVASLTLASFLIISLTPSFALAQNPNPQPQTPIKQQNKGSLDGLESTEKGDKVRVTLPSGRVEKGSVLGCSWNPTSWFTDCPGEAAEGALRAITGWGGDMIHILIVLVGKVMMYGVSIVNAAFGGDEVKAEDCADIPDNNKRTDCEDLVATVHDINPLLKPEVAQLTSRFNVFVFADSAFSGLYANFNGVHTPNNLAYEFQDNILGIKSAEAQGVGTKSLGSLVRSFWEKMRDVAYIALVIVLVVVGFMIMFRKKLDPRTAVTAANSLPRIIIALVLITFSFAISGLFIDLIFVSVEVVRNYLGTLPGLAGSLGDTNLLGLEGEFTWLPFFTLVSAPVLKLGAMLTMLAVAGIGVLAFGVGGVLAIVILLLGAIGVELFIRLILFVLAVLLFWALLKRFVTMLLLTIFSPFFFLMGAVPGFESVTINWFKRMLANAITFPALLVIVYLAVALLSADYSYLGKIPGIPSGSQGAPEPPPPIGDASLILNLSTLTGLGVLFFATQIPNLIDDLFSLKGPQGKAFGPGAAVGAGMGALSTVGNVNRAQNAFRSGGFMHRLLVGKTDDKGNVIARTPLNALWRKVAGFGSFVNPRGIPPAPPHQGSTPTDIGTGQTSSGAEPQADIKFRQPPSPKPGGDQGQGGGQERPPPVT